MYSVCTYTPFLIEKENEETWPVQPGIELAKLVRVSVVSVNTPASPAVFVSFPVASTG